MNISCGDEFPLVLVLVVAGVALAAVVLTVILSAINKNKDDNDK